jgi:SecD/SecF fusion protein
VGPGYVVTFALRDARKSDFTAFTTKHVKRLMAIIIDRKLESAPVIQETLPGRGQISGGGMGGFSREEAMTLVTVLRSGSLDVEIVLQEEFAIGPSLGEAAIRRGMLATGIGMGAVVLFMLFTYLFPGLVAIFALLMNLLMIMGALAFFKAQLSLPGIAGVILTVGMAVDANILVFERIREERRLGKTLIQAVKAGYDRAFVTIVDANVTTLFTAVVLYFFTTGQVRGFALTLVFGILASMFTALFVTKTIFAWMIDRGWVTEMRMPDIFGVPGLSYMKIRLPTIAISLVLVAAGVLAFAETGREKYDIEFLGGQRVVAQVKTPLNIADVKDRVFRQYPDAQVISIKSDKAQQEALDLSLQSTSFQITIAAADTEEERAQVLAFLETEFAEDLEPVGVVPTSPQDLAAGMPRTFDLNLRTAEDVEKDALEADLLTVLASMEGAGALEPQVVSITRLTDLISTASIRVNAANDELFLETLDRALGEKGELDLANDLELTSPLPMKSFVDPKTAQEHRDDAIKAVLISLVFQILYIYFRFHGASFGFAAVLALIHDVLITLGAIALVSYTGLVNVKINLPIIAAILTLIGYSMNDSIVVFDRIRENLGRARRNLSEVIDLSVNQTMGRSLRTSITTFVVVLVLFIVNYGAASSVLEGFAFVLMIGVITGTYSSIFVASPMLLFLPWHYLRGRRGPFWLFVGLSVLGAIAILFTEFFGPWYLWLCIAAIAAYPLYFLAELVYWLFNRDPDRALNIVLRAPGARV